MRLHLGPSDSTDLGSGCKPATHGPTPCVGLLAESRAGVPPSSQAPITPGDQMDTGISGQVCALTRHLSEISFRACSTPFDEALSARLW